MFLTTKRVNLIGKKEFVATVFDPDHKAFVVHIAILNINFNVGTIKLHLLNKTQIAHLKVNEILIKIFSK